MSGSNTSDPGSAPPNTAPDGMSPVSFSVHSLPDPTQAARAQQKSGRWRMLLVMAVCAAPVIASYFTFYVVKPSGSAYGELITPPVEIPADLPLTALDGQAVPATSLKGQWLLVAVQSSDCAAACEQQLFVQRQLREMLGKERGRLDKVWLIPDGGQPSEAVLAAVQQKGVEATVLRADAARLTAWLKPSPGHTLMDHFFIVDPMGRWMLRAPAQPDPKKLKGDLEKLLKASAGWDTAGR